MCTRSFVLIACAVVVLIPSLASWGQVTDLRFERSGTTLDLFLDFEGMYFGSQLLIGLDTGSILNIDSIEPAAPFPLTADPGDTFFVTSGVVPVTFSTVPVILHGAVDLGGDVDVTLTSTEVDIAWIITATQRGPEISDQTDFVVARIPFSPDASGVFEFYTIAGNEAFVFQARVEELIPEPTSLICVVSLGPGLLLTRRRNAVIGSS
ncbi:MAG: hypothetical protein AAF333_18135 [Planctomycetota bacterium]